MMNSLNHSPGNRFRSSPRLGDEENALWRRDDDEKFCDDNILDDGIYPDTIDDIKAKRRSRLHFMLAMVLLFCVVTIPLIITKLVLSGEKARHTGTVVESDDDDNIRPAKPPITEAAVTDVLSDFGIPEERSLLQQLAFDWVMADHGLSSYTDARIAHRFALACFYYSTYEFDTVRTPDPPKWTQKDHWMSIRDECDWFGITCNSNHAITAMALPKNNITGRIPTELGIFHSTLQLLDFSDNLLYMDHEKGDFAVFEKLTHLEELDMHDNFLASESGTPSEFAQLSHLRSLDISYNLLSGNLHLEYFAAMADNLQHLQLQGNYLTGHLNPIEVKELRNLISLDVRDNHLKTALYMLRHGGELPKLSKLWVENNEITGRIPTQIDSMTALTSLSLMNGTALTGSIPTEIGKLTNLERLWLGGNRLGGTIPTEMKSLTRLEVLELQQNYLSGEVPVPLCQALNESTYEHKNYAADCDSGDVKCDCCTECF